MYLSSPLVLEFRTSKSYASLKGTFSKLGVEQDVEIQERSFVQCFEAGFNPGLSKMEVIGRDVYYLQIDGVWFESIN